MPLPERSGAKHVDALNAPLPPPLTTRNLPPRQFLPRSAARDVSYLQNRSQLSSLSYREPSSNLMESGAGPSRVRRSSRASRSYSSSRSAKRRRTGPWPATWSSEEEEEQIDQLISDEDEVAQDTNERSSSGGDATIENSSSIMDASGSTSNIVAAPSGSSRVPVSSPSLRKILHTTNVDYPQKSPPPTASTSTPNPPVSASTSASTSGSGSTPRSPAKQPEPLAEYSCPICFFPPTNATLTPCGHICCGSCLFTAVKSTMDRGALMRADMNGARCPVCRADIPGWDGRGGGVIGLKPRAIFSL